MDILPLTETWLTDNQSDKLWLQSTPLNRDPYKILVHNRQNRRGGGIALILKSDFTTKLIRNGATNSFEYATWEISIKHKSNTFIAIYHPLYSLINKSTNRAFQDDFMDYMANLLLERANNIVLGDFNLHVSNNENIDSAIFNDTIKAMGLYQHVSFSTHRSGNTLDLIISELQRSISINTTAPGPYLTYHCAIISTLKKCFKREVRKLHKVATEDWIKEFQPENAELNTNLDEAVTNLGMEFKCTLDKLSPVKKCSVSFKPKMPWYDKEMAQHKARMRCCEKRRPKYKLPSCWIALKQARNSYYGKLNIKKKMVLKDQIAECASDSKRLYALIRNLTTEPNSTPWPTHKDKQSLAEEFADYFQDKILQIRKGFEGIPAHEESMNYAAPHLGKITTLTGKEVTFIIKQMKTKSCDSYGLERS